MWFKCVFCSIFFTLVSSLATCQVVDGYVISGMDSISFAKIKISNLKLMTQTDATGHFTLYDIPAGKHAFEVMAFGFSPFQDSIQFPLVNDSILIVELKREEKDLSNVVISGNMRPVSKSNSPIHIESFSANFFKMNPNPTLFESLQNVNGVRPQVNCNVCSTGDIHINGMEGPYTMILIDGMPIVSGLGTVYGLNGIPQSMIERVEVVKGPASTLYGSEAVGGLINVITKNPGKFPLLSIDLMGTTYGELNADVGTKFKVGKIANSMLGVNYFNYSFPTDKNDDGFTDVTLQDRISIFNNWSFQRKENRIFTLAGRYVYEDRWGGQMNWNKSMRGSDSIYGESIYTSRWELMMKYQLPIKEKIFVQLSANQHQQNSFYGTTRYNGNQLISFAQVYWDKQVGKHAILSGISYRYTFYDDNTQATLTQTENGSKNQPNHMHLPGIFVQDEWTIGRQSMLLGGIRYDYNMIHGSIFSPRLNYKWNSKNQQSIWRIGIGNGYRVANVFTEDHAALTGARTVVFKNELKPETSWNFNTNFTQQLFFNNNRSLELDLGAFYTYFSNKIVPDYETDPNSIIYDNLNEFATSYGANLALDYRGSKGLAARVGATVMEVSIHENGKGIRQLFTERFTGTWNVSYTFSKVKLRIDYTGNVYSPMRLPLLGETDPRPAYSPWWSIQNIQVTKTFRLGMEIYGGVKNLLNWRPDRSTSMMIARAHDPFDNLVSFDAQGNALATSENPNALTFDPSYVFAPMQGIRGFLGIRYTFK